MKALARKRSALMSQNPSSSPFRRARRQLSSPDRSSDAPGPAGHRLQVQRLRAVWKLDRLGWNLAHLVNTVQDLAARGVGPRVLAGQGAQVGHHDRGRPASCSAS